MTDALVTYLAKLPAAGNLTSLALVTSGSVHAAASATLFVTTGQLTRLEVSTHLAGEHSLRVLAAALSAARGGGTPPLARLHLHESFGGACSWRTLSQLQPKFPELETLEIAKVCDDYYGGEPGPPPPHTHTHIYIHIHMYTYIYIYIYKSK